MRLRSLPSLSGLAALLLGLGGAAAPAAAVTFGPNIDALAPNTSFGCDQGLDAIGRLTASGVASCTYSTSGRLGVAGDTETHLVPTDGPGVVTAARIRTGPRTGPMRFTLLKFIRDPRFNGDTACCFGVAESAAFTPPANAISTVPLRLPYVNQFTKDENGLVSGHIVAITPQDTQAAIPLFSTGSRSASNGNYASGSFYPGVRPDGQPRTDQRGEIGLAVLFQANAEPDADRDGLGDETQDPDRGAAGGAGSAGSSGSSEGEKSPAKLQVQRAGVTGGRLDVLTRLTKRASGEVEVSYTSGGKTIRFTQDIENGTVRFKRTLSGSQRRKTTGIVKLSYAGDDDVRADDVRLRAASGKAKLKRKTAAISDGQLKVSGTISRRARGVVRVRMNYPEADGSLKSVLARAKIESGRWSLSAVLPDRAAAVGGQLSIQYTGFEPRRIRGEQDAKQVRP